MAGTKRRGTLGAPMSRGEIIGGFLYLPIYIIGLSWLINFILNLLGFSAEVATRNAIYFVLNLLVVVLIFHQYLFASFRGVFRPFWPFLQSLVLGFAFYFFLTWLLGILFTLLKLNFTNPNDAYVASLAGANFTVIAICTIFLAPIVEETLFRGLIFGNLHATNRYLAYIVSAMLFAAIHVWQYVGQVGWSTTLLAAVQYIPAGVALGWTYEKSDTIWAPIIVHAVINAIGMGILY